MTLITFGSCDKEIIPERFYPKSDHEDYEHSLGQANLLNSALGKAWQRSSIRALEKPIPVSPPFEETFYFDANKADGVGYRFPVKRGQKVMVNVTSSRQDSALLFMDLFRIVDDSLNQTRQVATADKYEHIIAFEPRRDADYILRVQPELLQGGNFNIKVLKVAAFQFPVAGKDKRAIHSVFGDPRDGGRREHHGVDIFAKRHTPIIAPTSGRIRSVATRGIGGRVVWLYDTKRRQSLYFAHLETQLVKRNQNVNKGDTLGTVGNTGNAKSTPPHLHFGIYKNGPIDPYHFIVGADTVVSRTTLDTARLGNWARLSQQAILNRLASSGHFTDTLNKHDMIRIVAAQKGEYRVRMPDQTEAYISPELVEPIATPLVSLADKTEIMLLETPTDKSFVKSNLHGSDSLDVLGVYNGYSFVRTFTGETGWVKLSESALSD